jgi:pimeloyl-ACP methyl ester carboxylesterase
MQWAARIATAMIRARLNLLAVISPRMAARAALKLFFTPFGRRNIRMPDVFRKAEHLRFRSGGGWVQLYRWNHPAAKKFLILHGFSSCAFKFDAYVMPMVRRGYEVLAIDAPAHGRSEGRRVSLTDYMQAIRDVESGYGPFEAYMAHSFGGLAVSLHLEDKVSDARPRLALVAPATETRRAIDTFFRFMQLDGRVRARFETLIREKSGREPDYFSISRAAPGMAAEVLWVHDEDDDLTPLDDARPVMEAGLPHIRFHITRGLGHRRIYRDPEVRRAIINFLSQQTGRFSE